MIRTWHDYDCKTYYLNLRAHHVPTLQTKAHIVPSASNVSSIFYESKWQKLLF